MTGLHIAYLDKKGNMLIILGIEKPDGKKWATFSVRKNGIIKRVYSRLLPVKEYELDAFKDLKAYAIKHKMEPVG